MSRKRELMSEALICFVILFAGICWAEAGNAYEPWGGKATTDLNVRSSPRVGAQVIAWLRKGQGITVNGEEENWYKIVFDVEGKGNREGWVNSRLHRKGPLGKGERGPLIRTGKNKGQNRLGGVTAKDSFGRINR